jgi:signal transduction histidine kinase/signal recognition particle receptor subunit beta
MGFINLAEKTVHAKLVYYGIGAGGKTTSLQAVHGVMSPSNDVKLVSIKTEQDATLLFDFLPINLGTVEGYQILIQGFTVPGQPKYKRMRKYVLQGADAVVLVVDSQRSRLEENCEALASLRENLRSNGLNPDTIPIVIQYNKRDLDDILTEEEMNPHFLIRDDIQAFPSVATDTQGVYETFVHAAGQLVEQKIRQYDLGKGQITAEEVAESARNKLWSLFDVWRELQGDGLERNVAEFTVDEEKQVCDADLPKTTDSASDDKKAEGDAGAHPAEHSAHDDWNSLLDAVRKKDDDPNTEIQPETPPEDVQAETVTPDVVVEREQEPVPGPGETTVTELAGMSGAAESAPLSELFSDEELDFDLNQTLAVAGAEPVAPLDDGESGLLDMALQSNLQMAEAFGELDQHQMALRRKNEELIKFTQNTIHDLNKPLLAIKLMLTSVIKGYFGETEGRVESAIENSMAAVDMMERLVGDLMDSIVLDTTFEMKFAEVDLGILIGEVLRTLRYNIEEYDVGLRVEPMPVIMADEWALTKAFMNLIGNAIQYRSPDREPRIWISYEDEGESHVIIVSDNGIGVPEGDRHDLFLRFERGANTSGVSGTGLGLHIVKEAIAGHGGTIELDSEEGVGTTFTIRLPKAPVTVPQSEITQTVGV